MKRVLSLLAALGVTVSLLAGCGSDDGPGAEGYDLTFWVYSDFVQGESGKLMNQFVEEFKAENPDVNSVKLVPKNDAELLSSLMAGVGLPDAFSASARDAKEYRGVIDLIDLEASFEEDADYASGFYPEALDAVTTDDGVWAVPFISYIPVIYRNLTVLEKAGVDPAAGIPTTDAFLQQLEQVEKSGVDATHSWTSGGYFAPGALMASDAPDITAGAEEGKTTIKPEQLTRTFETVEAIEEHANGSMTYDADVTMEAFKSDKLGYMIGGPWSEPAIKQSGVKYDFVLVPPHEEGGWTGGLEGWDFLYGVQSDDERRNELTAAWLHKLGTYDAQKAWTLKVGRATLRQDVMEDREVVASSNMAKVSSTGLQAGMLQMDFMDSSVFWPDAISGPAAQLGKGDITAEEAAKQFVEDIDELYAEAGE